jgi:molybdopterin synthase sulfur carrier subunit
LKHIERHSGLTAQRHNGKKNLRGGFMTVKVLFFGVLAEVTGINCKHYSEVKSVNDLKMKIRDEFPEVVHYDFRISVNNELIDNDQPLKDGDELALMPPFAGG